MTTRDNPGTIEPNRRSATLCHSAYSKSTTFNLQLINSNYRTQCSNVTQLYTDNPNCVSYRLQELHHQNEMQDY